MIHEHRHAFTNHQIHHEEIDRYAAANEALSKRIWHVLQQHYPGHPWGVGVNHEQGIAQIFLPTFTEWSWIIRLNELFVDPGMRMVIRGAGEMLERYRMPRSGFDVSHYLTAQKRFMPHWTRNLRPPS